MTLYGRGFTRPLSIVLSPRYQNSSAMGRETLTIDENSSGAAGEILYADAERVEFRMPDLSGEDVASAFEIPASVRYSRLNAFVRCRYAQSSTGRRADRFAGVLTQVVNDGLQLLSVRVVKLGSPGTVGGVVAFGHAETDPALLDPEAEAVYALELEVYNGGDTQLAGIQLDLERTEAEYAGATITATAFGDEVVAELIFAPAQSDGASADLEPGAFATLEVRFVIREASLDAGDELVLVPVVVGTSDQGVVFSDDSERTPPVTVAVVVADDASTPLLVDQAPEDEVWEEGTGISLRWPLQSLAQGDGAVRSAHLVALELRVTPAGQSPFFVRAEGPIFSMPESPNAIRLVSVPLENGTAKEELPFLMLGDEVEVVLALEADEGFIGEVEIELGAVMRESLTGVETTVTRTVQTEVMP